MIICTYKSRFNDGIFFFASLSASVFHSVCTFYALVSFSVSPRAKQILSHNGSQFFFLHKCRHRCCRLIAFNIEYEQGLIHRVQLWFRFQRLSVRCEAIQPSHSILMNDTIGHRNILFARTNIHIIKCLMPMKFY